ncbi:chymotrypsin-2-like [Teleopsis dalmanni]|uniref:chymotrypsin-2-like n=1 Tax=Teleopsis dalmanni TaxID=139649 RepID=UPI0018CFC004|nr:chymotrypsin-2-like [Teleopsis dalmanni]
MNWCIVFVILIMHCIYICGGTEDEKEFSLLIRGGYRRNDTKFTKYIVSLKYERQYYIYGDNHICAGSIISTRSVLTAAHCLCKERKKEDKFIQMRPARKYTVVAGSKYRLQLMSTTQSMEVQKTFVHPKYDDVKVTADVGLLLLKKEFTFDGTTVAPIPLATETPKVDTKCIAGGWGMVYWHGPTPDNIIFADLNVLDDDYCRDIMSFFAVGLICAGNKKTPHLGTNPGDSGGPLICNGFVCGVVSAGKAGDMAYPNMYADVAYYRDWILDPTSDARQSYYFAKLIFVKIVLVVSLL